MRLPALSYLRPDAALGIEVLLSRIDTGGQSIMFTEDR